MPKRPDLNQFAASIVSQTTEDQSDEKAGKNPAAVELGRLGGLKGGRERAEKLSAARRKAIARKAAAGRWKKRRDETR